MKLLGLIMLACCWPAAHRPAGDRQGLGGDGYVEYYVEATDGLGNVGQSGSPVIGIQYCLG